MKNAATTTGAGGAKGKVGKSRKKYKSFPKKQRPVADKDASKPQPRPKETFPFFSISHFPSIH